MFSGKEKKRKKKKKKRERKRKRKSKRSKKYVAHSLVPSAVSAKIK